MLKVRRIVTIALCMLVVGAVSAAADDTSAEGGSLLKKLIFSISAEPEDGTAPLKVRFDVELYDDDMTKPVFLWNFGDGESSKEKSPVHTFKKPGDYKVTLRVEDTGDRSGTDDILIIVEKKE